MPGINEICDSIRLDTRNPALFLELARLLERSGKQSCFVDRMKDCRGMCCAEWAYRQAWYRAPDDPLPPEEIARIRDFENIRDIAERWLRKPEDSNVIAGLGRTGEFSVAERLTRIASETGARRMYPRYAARALGMLGIPEAFGTLVSFFSDWSEDESDAALKGLANMQHPDAMPILIKALEHREPHHRLAAVEGLIPYAGIGLLDVTAERFFRLALGDDIDVAHAAAKALAAVVREEDMPLLEILFKRDDEFIKREAVSGLRKVGTDKVYNMLENSLSEPDPDGYWKPYAVGALVDAPDGSKRINKAFDSSEITTLLAAAEALYRIGEPDRLNELAKAMEPGIISGARFEAFGVMKNWSTNDISEEWEMYFDRAYVHEEPNGLLIETSGVVSGDPMGPTAFAWNVILLALTRVRHELSAKLLVDLAKNGVIRLEAQTYRAMAEFPDPEMVSAISSLLDSNWADHAELLAHALGKIGDPDALPDLEKERGGRYRSYREPNAIAELAAHYAMKRMGEP
ncbi:MAG: HEAT repeat domain-containing protein [Planctomycetota bacterium]|nr:MAG: HEAT repeat domain-containing protein [Planctomycetota bacterium]